MSVFFFIFISGIVSPRQKIIARPTYLRKNIPQTRKPRNSTNGTPCGFPSLIQFSINGVDIVFREEKPGLNREINVTLIDLHCSQVYNNTIQSMLTQIIPGICRKTAVLASVDFFSFFSRHIPFLLCHVCRAGTDKRTDSSHNLNYFAPRIRVVSPFIYFTSSTTSTMGCSLAIH